MDKKILRIVITGGPCGGKTTALEQIAKIFREQGYTIFTVNETATELINDGIKPFGNDLDRLKTIDFQRLVLDAQYAKEQIRDEAARACSNDKVVILYDRGILDNRAYITHEEFKELAKAKGLTEAEILSKYDLVLHLTTAADGAEKDYSLDNNSARTETIEEARAIDKKTKEAWSTHPNQYIFDNDGIDFDQKLQRVGNVIRGYLGEEEVLHREKYVVEIKGLDLSQFSGLNLIREEIEEFVGLDTPNQNEMYRKSTIADSTYYTYTKIRYREDGTKTTMQRNITEREYLENLERTGREPIKKVRYNFISKGERFRLDSYLDTYGLMTLERDVTKPNIKNIPGFITKVREITDDRAYSSASIYKAINKHREEERENDIYKVLKLKRKQDK